MSFLHKGSRQDAIVTPSVERRRLCIMRELLDRFRQAFPNVVYEPVIDLNSVNAQAWRLGASRYVRIFAGLVRQRALSVSGLSLVLAHETGHHLGGPPYDPALPWMSWQGQADYWAASVGMPRVWGSRARRMTLRGAAKLELLHRELHHAYEDEDEWDLPIQCRFKFLNGAPTTWPAPTGLMSR